jgi:two-component system, cell cycle response regulator
LRILIADDDLISRRILALTLKKLEYEVVEVCDGTEALAALVANDAPRLAILDWMMPGLDGLSVCREMRKRLGPYTYIILLTGLDSPEDLVIGLESGADDFLTKPFHPEELRARLRSGVRILDLQRELIAAQQTLQRQATRDDLTGLWNRRMILGHLESELNRGNREQVPIAVAIADLDFFKKINDTEGHVAGDCVLRDTAATLQLHLRSYDFIGRYGGEEFLIILPGCDTPAGLQIAERVRAAVAATPVKFDGLALPITVSIGLSSTADVGFDSGSLFAAADAALYRAKAEGRNRVVG